MPTMLELLKEEQKKNEKLEKQNQSLKKRLDKMKLQPSTEVPVVKEVIKEVPVVKEVKVPDKELQNRYYLACDKNVEINRKYEDLKKKCSQLKMDKSVYVKRAADLEEQLKAMTSELEDVKAIKQKPVLVIRDLAPVKIGEWKDNLAELTRIRQENDQLYAIIHKYEAGQSEEIEQKTEEIESLKMKVSDLQETIDCCDSIVEVYQKENDELKEEIEKLKKEKEQLMMDNQVLQGKLMSKEITIRSIKDRERIPIIFEGIEHDLYEGEHKDIVLGYLKESIKNLEPYTRRYSIIKSILEANQESGKRDEIKRGVISTLRDYRGMTSSKKKELSELGFEVIGNEPHMKLVFCGDERYSISMSGTPSDASRNGLNSASVITKMVL